MLLTPSAKYLASRTKKITMGSRATEPRVLKTDCPPEYDCTGSTTTHGEMEKGRHGGLSAGRKKGCTFGVGVAGDSWAAVKVIATEGGGCDGLL